MIGDSGTDSIRVSLSALINLGIEHWRLSSWLAKLPSTDATAPARHASRRMADFLKLAELETRNMDGHPFDPGLAVHVVDTCDDPKLTAGNLVIAETLSPLVLWRGKVVKAAEVVTHRGTGPASSRAANQHP